MSWLHGSPQEPPQGQLRESPVTRPWSVEAGKLNYVTLMLCLTLPALSKLPHRPLENSPSPVPFFHLLERLKTTPREGWRRFDIGHGESIADHMYRMSIITMLAPPSLSSRVNVSHCTKMALIHDMAESLVGDITPMDGVAKVEKSRREEETINYICGKLLGEVYGGIAAADIKNIWREYEDSTTIESLYVHDVDKIELLLQMVEYEKAHDAKLDLSEFSRVAEKLSLGVMKEWAQEILEEQDAFWKSRGKDRSVPDMLEEVKKQQDDYYDDNKAS